MGTRNMDFFWQYVNIVIVIVFGCIAMSLSELVARGQLINERVAMTGDGGCCIIESLVRPHKPPPFLCRGTPRGVCVCFFKASFTCHKLSHHGAIVTTCHIALQLFQLVTQRSRLIQLGRVTWSLSCSKSLVAKKGLKCWANTHLAHRFATFPCSLDVEII